MCTTNTTRDPASFRDPCGFVFRDEDGTLLRQVNSSYAPDYRLLMDSGLYEDLVTAGMLIEHEELPRSQARGEDAYCLIRPREVPFISYPYEWPFSALKEAALLTLEIQHRARNFGMSLKDASSYNVQFHETRPVLIDTLSFEKCEPARPWVAYAQFCRHFLAPLALMAKTDTGLNRLLLVHLDGIPLDLASKLLPWRTRFQLGLFLHLHLHAKMVKHYSDTSQPRESKFAAKGRVTSPGMTALLDNLRRTIAKLSMKTHGTEWVDYYRDNSYSSEAFEEKRAVVTRFLRIVQPSTVWDLGANTGIFSCIASDLGARTYAFDIDPACVEMNFRQCRRDNRSNLLPLLLDLTNPTPAIGWAHEERRSLAGRGPVDAVMALALVHHLAISNNLPFRKIAAFLYRLTRHLIIEFVPRSDPQVKRLLRCRRDSFDDYHQVNFEAAFEQRFSVREKRPIGQHGRILYLMEAIDSHNR